MPNKELLDKTKADAANAGKVSTERNKFLDELADLPPDSQQTRLKAAEGSGDLARWSLDFPRKEDGSFDLGPLEKKEKKPTGSGHGGADPMTKSRQTLAAKMFEVWKDPHSSEGTKDWAMKRFMQLQTSLGVGDGTVPPSGGFAPMTPYQSKSASQRDKTIHQGDEKIKQGAERIALQEKGQELAANRPSAKFKAAQSEYAQLREYARKLGTGQVASVDQQAHSQAVASTNRRLGELESQYPVLGKGWGSQDRSSDAETVARTKRESYYSSEVTKAKGARDFRRLDILQDMYYREFGKKMPVPSLHGYTPKPVGGASKPASGHETKFKDPATGQTLTFRKKE